MRFTLFVLAMAVAVNAISLEQSHNGHKTSAKKHTLFDLVQTVGKGKGKGKAKSSAKVKVQGQITLSVSKEASTVKLPEKEQLALFMEMDGAKSSLSSLGYKYWRPTPGGFNFLKTAPKAVSSSKHLPTSTEDMIVCEASAAKDMGKQIDLTFNCEQTMDKMRFSKAAKADAKQYPWGWVDPAYYGAYYDPRVTGWTACPNYAVGGSYAPYGWTAQWGAWNYQYYILSPYGYYGCSSLNGPYCADSPVYYATSLDASAYTTPYYVVGG